MYTVEWSPSAAEDLWVKVRSHSVATELIMVAKEALDAPSSKDGGMLGPYVWRRGVTLQRRKELDAAAARGEDLDHSTEHSWDYVLVCKRRGARGGFRVLAVYTNGELAAGLEYLSSLDSVPES